MLIEAVERRIRYRLQTGEEIILQPGIPVEVPDQAANQLLQKAGAQVRIARLTPTPPIQTGWFVVFRDQADRLCGGADDRDHGTVHACRWDGLAWNVCLTDGQQLPLTAILSVAKTDAEGRVIAAWLVGAHGFDGGS